MRLMLLAVALIILATPALAGSKIGGGSPGAVSPCDAACEQAKRDAEKAAEEAMANGPGFPGKPPAGAPKKKGGAPQGSPSGESAATPPPSSEATGPWIGAPSARPSSPKNVSAVGLQAPVEATQQTLSVPEQKAKAPPGPRPH